jgi:hypothetical protein
MFRHTARIVNVLSGAACTGAMHRFAMIVKLKRDADNFIARALHQPGDDRGIDAARHRDDNAVRGGISGKIKRGNHGVHSLELI